MGNKLTEIRRAKKITRAALSALTGVSPMWLYYIEKGVRASDNLKDRISKALGVQVGEIWPSSDSETKLS